MYCQIGSPPTIKFDFTTNPTTSSLSDQILHRDLATRNILVGEGKLCKITNFGLAQDIVEIHQYEKYWQVGHNELIMPTPWNIFK